jgi:hypothetical protein
MALTPDRFDSFPTLARLLGYLRASVSSTVIDCVRAQAAGERGLDEYEAGAGATPERIVMGELARDALWSLVMDLVTDEAERVVLVESCVHGLPPRAIRARHLRLFPDVTAVYAVKRNLFQRLQRNRKLLRLHEDLVDD